MCVYMCLCVCQSVCLSVAYRRSSVILRRGNAIPIPREGTILGVFFPTDNALYSIAFGTHTTTAEPIEMPFGLMTRVSPRYYVFDGDPRSPKREG